VTEIKSGGNLVNAQDRDEATEVPVTFTSVMTVSPVRLAARDADIVFAARVSTLGETSRAYAGSADDDRQLESGDRGLINFLMRNRHGTPFEHNSMTFYVHAPIFVFREFQRHRIASYNEESARYRQLQPTFYVPNLQRRLMQTGKPGHYVMNYGSGAQYNLVNTTIRAESIRAYRAYVVMLEAGIAREVARMVLPVNIYSSMYVTMNARALMNFLSLRSNQPGTFPSYPMHEISVVAGHLEYHWQNVMPITHQAFVTNGRVAP